MNFKCRTEVNFLFSSPGVTLSKSLFSLVLEWPPEKAPLNRLRPVSQIISLLNVVVILEFHSHIVLHCIIVSAAKFVWLHHHLVVFSMESWSGSEFLEVLWVGWGHDGSVGLSSHLFWLLVVNNLKNYKMLSYCNRLNN